MSFRDIDTYGFPEEIIKDGIAESTIRDGLVNLQASVRNIGDQISRLAQTEPTQRTIAIMRSLLNESATAIAGVETSFKQWRNTTCDNTSAMRRKLILPKLEASFFLEVEKFQKSRTTVDAIESQLQPSNSDTTFSLMQPENYDVISHLHMSSSQMVPFSPLSLHTDIDEFTDLPLDQFPTKEQQLVNAVGWKAGQDVSYTSPYQADALRSPVGSGLPAVSSLDPTINQDGFGHSSFVPAPITVGRNFYDHADDTGENENKAPDTSIVVRRAMSSSCSTATGGSGSPSSEDDGVRRTRPSTASSSNTPHHSVNHSSLSKPSHTTTDDFLEDDYLYQSNCRNTSSQADMDDDQDEVDEELSGLLSRGSARSASYLDGWHLTVDKPRQDNDLQLYISRERLRGVHRIKAQLSQAAQVFRELAHLIHEQQEDLDLIDSNMLNVKAATGSAVDELRKANILKQKARRRNFFMILLTLVVGAIVLFVYSLQGASSASLAQNRVSGLPVSPPVVPVAKNIPETKEVIDEVVVKKAQRRAG